jgi:hypothetical protein
MRSIPIGHCADQRLKNEKKAMSKKRKWPAELEGPFPIQKLEHDAIEAAGEAGNSEQLYTQYLRKFWETEAKRRVALIAQFFNKPWPQSEEGWLEIVFLNCSGFEAPGFQSGLPGAPEKWTRAANRRLFADVMSVVAKQKMPSERAAVKSIFDHPSKFLDRYSKYTFLTLHRQFQRVKREFEKNDRALRKEGLDPTDQWGRIMSRDDVIRQESTSSQPKLIENDEPGLRKNQQRGKLRNNASLTYALICWDLFCVISTDLNPPACAETHGCAPECRRQWRNGK